MKWAPNPSIKRDALKRAPYVDTGIEADYIVVEMAKHLLGEDWLQGYLAKANNGGIKKIFL